MQKGILLALALLLSACSSQNDKKYYQLPIIIKSAAVISTPGAATFGSAAGAKSLSGSDGALLSQVPGHSTPCQLWISSVSVADFLAGNGLVYQTNDVQYVMANNNLWASPLEQQLQQTMVADLSSALPGTLVSMQQLGNNDDSDTLAVNITGFHGRYDGRAIVQGEWLLTHDGRVTRRPFNLMLKQDKDGYDALVRTLAEGWKQVSQQVAKSVMAIY